jgi:choline dehydrogenase-like flavoprotein
MLIGVYGDSEGIENSPDSPPGVLLPPPAARTGELLARKHARSLGIPVVPAHRAVLSTRLDDRNIPAKLHPGNPRAQRLVAESMRARAACLWATHCHRGCSVGAAYQSTTVHLPPALASGLLDVLPDAMVREVTLDARGRADGVIFIDKRTGREARARGRAVVLAASSAETVRIMLNSRSPSFPQGLGNSTGLVGRYITDTVGASFGGQVPQLESLPPLNEDGAGGLHVYVPWWLCREQAAGRLDFPRGYHIEFATGRTMPGIGIAAGAVSMTRGGSGRRFKEDMRRYFGSFVTFTGRGEMIPNAKSFCELDPQVKDRWGIPVLRFHWQWSDHELRQVVHMQRTFADLIVAMGGKVRGTPDADGRRAIVQPGAVIHEVGGAIMGADAHSSVTNRWSQVWDVPNVILADGAPFASNADKNPTLTIMALAWRACDHLLSEMKRGNL